MSITSTETLGYPRPATQGVPNYFASTASSPERERILIVDDSATIRKSFSNLLVARYDCWEAQNVFSKYHLRVLCVIPLCPL